MLNDEACFFLMRSTCQSNPLRDQRKKKKKYFASVVAIAANLLGCRQFLRVLKALAQN